MKKLLLTALILICWMTSAFAQNIAYDNKKTATGEIYRAVYHKLDTKFPSVGRSLMFQNVWHTIREVIDGNQSTFYYEIYYDYEKPQKARFSVEDLRNVISALEQIYKEWTDNKGGESMYFAKNGFMIGYDTASYHKWQISLCRDDGIEEVKTEKIPEIISVFKTALSEMGKLSK